MKGIDNPSPNFEARPANSPIDMLVLHYTGMTSGKAALNRLCDSAAGVSAHFLIDEDGTLYCLVDERARAWHAGKSFWRGNSDINDRSIGIELVNPGHEFGYRAFPEPQMETLITLAKDLITRHPIPPRNVVGHSDVAPSRKQDPGELFDWRRLAAMGAGLWPEPATKVEREAAEMLARYGYDISSTDIITAFQRHFRQSNITGIADDETTALAAGLLRLIE
jgi:N-acetylmuramoyl-L-alanine amidase